MNGYSVTTNYPRREDRIVTIQGNRMRVPTFAIPAGASVTEWTDYRVVYDGQTKRLYRIVDAVNGDSYVEYPYQISKRAHQFEMLSTLATRRTQPWTLRKLNDRPEARPRTAGDASPASAPTSEDHRSVEHVTRGLSVVD